MHFILWAYKNDAVVKYTIANTEDQLLVSKYFLKLLENKVLEYWCNHMQIKKRTIIEYALKHSNQPISIGSYSLHLK